MPPITRRRLIMLVNSFTEKYVGASEWFEWDFIQKVTSGTITGATVTCTRISGSVDATPQNMVSGNEIIDGKIVRQKIIGGVAGTKYQLSCAITTSDVGSITFDTTVEVVADPS